MKNMKKRIVSMLCATCTLFGLASAAASPGTDDDPLITKSYIDSVVYPYIDEKAAASGTAAVEIVNVAAGKTICGDAGTELILRSGSARIVSTEKGGVCDATAGLDLPNGSPTAANHLLIVPVGDGRGLYAADDCIVMVRGGYSVY